MLPGRNHSIHKKSAHLSTAHLSFFTTCILMNDGHWVGAKPTCIHFIYCHTILNTYGENILLKLPLLAFNLLLSLEIKVKTANGNQMGIFLFLRASLTAKNLTSIKLE